jgi:hypothetical protein
VRTAGDDLVSEPFKKASRRRLAPLAESLSRENASPPVEPPGGQLHGEGSLMTIGLSLGATGGLPTRAAALLDKPAVAPGQLSEF